MFIHSLERAWHLESITAHYAANQDLRISRKRYHEKPYSGIQVLLLPFGTREAPSHHCRMQEESVSFMVRVGSSILKWSNFKNRVVKKDYLPRCGQCTKTTVSWS